MIEFKQLTFISFREVFCLYLNSCFSGAHYRMMYLESFSLFCICILCVKSGISSNTNHLTRTILSKYIYSARKKIVVNHSLQDKMSYYTLHTSNEYLFTFIISDLVRDTFAIPGYLNKNEEWICNGYRIILPHKYKPENSILISIGSMQIKSISHSI